MRIVVVTGEELPLLLLDPEPPPDELRLFLSDTPALSRQARRRGFRTATGELTSSELYRRVRITPTDRILLHLPRGRMLARALDALLRVQPNASITVLLGPHQRPPSRWDEQVFSIHPHEVGAGSLRALMERAITRRSLSTIRSVIQGADRVLLLVQDDPDPDGLAAALALRSLLGRNRLTATIGSFGEVKRPENIAMTRLLDIHVERLGEGDVAAFDRVALLDVQPMHSPGIPAEVDLIIDHHPRRPQARARFADIRPRYGATSTIMTEYLLASGAPISQRLATALLYGIKTDTQLLGRDTTPMDVSAFSTLYALANHALLRRIDRPQFPRSDVAALGRALEQAEFVDDLLFAHMGPLAREDVVPFIADFCLGLEGVEWAVVSGIAEGKLTISVRNFGAGRSAGEVMKAAFEAYGSAGGHKAMAKAVIPLDRIPPECLDHDAWIRDRFLVALYEERNGNGRRR